MRRLASELRMRARALFARTAMEHDLDHELQLHLEYETAKLARRGLSSEEARRQALASFGGVQRIKDDARDARGLVWLDVLRQDLSWAWRTLRRSPGFTTAVVLTLGLGVGANTAIFSVLDRLLLRPPAMLRDAERVHRVYLASRNRQGQEESQRSIEYRRYLDLSRFTHSFDAAAAYYRGDLAVGAGESAQEARAAMVSASFFGLFDAPPALGRYFTEAEDRVPRGADVVVLSWSYWQSHFGGRRDVLGAPLEVGSLRLAVIGVTPRGFEGTGDGVAPSLYLPITTYAASRPDRDTYYQQYHWSWMNMLVRRAPGVSVATADADLTAAYRLSWSAESQTGSALPPMELARPRAEAGPMLVERGPDRTAAASVATWVAGVAAIVLLIACANVGNLLLARAVRRRREIALRLALGVTRRRLFTSLLVESLVLALLGAAAGALIARWGGALLQPVLAVERQATSGPVDGRLLLFTLAAATFAGVVSGLAPMMQVRLTSLTEPLKSGVREGTFQRSRLRRGLLLLQGTLSVVLLIAAGLFVRSLRNVREVRLGFDVEPLLYVGLNMRGTSMGDTARAELARRLEAEARATPGVRNASRAITVPMWNFRSTELHVAGIDSVRRIGRFGMQTASPGYFATMGTRLLRGRAIGAEDRAGAPAVAVVSDAMARALWPGQDAIGQCMRVGADTMPCTTIVGIAENIHEFGVGDEKGYYYYLAADQYLPADADLFVRTVGDASKGAEALRRQLQRLMPGSAYVTVTPMRDIVAPQLLAWSAGATLFMILGALALALAAIGLYSVIAYDVAQRTHELGVRLALGARGSALLRTVVAGGLRFALIGMAAGGAIAAALGPLVRPLLFGVSPHDLVVYVVVGVVMVLVALAACAVPALRALRVNPGVALRAD